MIHVKGKRHPQEYRSFEDGQELQLWKRVRVDKWRGYVRTPSFSESTVAASITGTIKYGPRTTKAEDINETAEYDRPQALLGNIVPELPRVFQRAVQQYLQTVPNARGFNGRPLKNVVVPPNMFCKFMVEILAFGQQ